MTEGLRRVAAALLLPFTDPESRTYLPWLVLAALIGVGWHLVRRGGLRDLPRALGLVHWRRPSVRLDVELLVARRLLAVLWSGPKLGAAWVVGTALARALDRWIGVPEVPAAPALVVSVGYSLALFVAWDLSRWAVHRAMHRVPLLWQFHQVHHSAEVLTPLTFHRVHPVESLVYDLRGALVSGSLAGLAFWLFRGTAVEIGILGVNAIGLVLNAATGNLRHSHVWIPFGPTVERWLLSPAQHQLHHAVDRDGCNYGSWLACWDRLTGDLALSPATAPPAYGVRERNHGDDLGSVLLGPLLAAGRMLLLVLPWTARAQDPADDADPDYEILVVAPDGSPRVAGSAHVVTEEELERFEYTDVTKVLGKVPGVVVRGEDGFGLRPNIGMRGGNSDRSAKITLLEDGIPLSPAPYAAPAAYYFPLTQRLVGIEVFKGPAAIKHGPQTIGGAVNVLTRRVPDAPSGALDVAAGMRDSAKLHAWGGTGNDRFGVLLEGAHLSSGGFKELDTGGPTGFTRQDVMLKARAGTADDSASVEIKLGYGREESDETYLGLALADYEDTPYRRYAASALDHMSWDHTQASVTWAVDLGRVDLRAVAYHASLLRAWNKFNAFAGGPDVHDLLQSPAPLDETAERFIGILRGERDSEAADEELAIGTNDRRFQQGGVQLLGRHHAGGEQVGNQLELGLRLHGDDVTRLHTEDLFAMTGGFPLPTGADTAVTLDSRSTAQALAGWVHDDLRLGPAHLIPGARVELIRTATGTSVTGPIDPVDQSALLPGFGTLVAARPWLDVFAGVHRGFSPVAPGSDPESRPETAWSYEAGARVHEGELQAEAVGFFSDYDNVVGQCTLSGGCTDAQVDQQFNGGEASVYGVESLVTHHVGLPRRFGVGGTASYTFTRAVFRTGFLSEFPQFGDVVAGDSLPYVPVHQGSVTLYGDHPRGQLALSATGRSDLRDVAGQGEIPRAERVPGAVLFDVAGTLNVSRTASAYVTVTNLADAAPIESFRPYGARPAAPLQAMVGVKVDGTRRRAGSTGAGPVAGPTSLPPAGIPSPAPGG